MGVGERGPPGREAVKMGGKDGSGAPAGPGVCGIGEKSNPVIEIIDGNEEDILPGCCVAGEAEITREEDGKKGKHP